MPLVTPPQATIGVVVVSWNVRDLLRRCLASLTESSLPLAVVVVDNASSDGSEAMVRTEFPAVRLIQSGRNLGFTGGNNLGLKVLGVLPGGPGNPWSTSLPDSTVEAVRTATPTSGSSPAAPPFVMLLNPDAELVGDALAPLLAELEAHSRCGVVGPLLVYPDGTLQSSRRRFPTLASGLMEGTPFDWHWPANPAGRRYRMEEDAYTADRPPPAGPVDWVTGAAMLFRSEALAASGGFDEGFFMYAEELDLCRRLGGLGWTTRFTPAARVIHHEGRSSEQAVGARHRRFARSRLRYFAKHHGRLSALIIRLGLIAEFTVEAVIEAAKGLLGHKRDLRRTRLVAYGRVIADLLGFGPGAHGPT